MATSTAAKTSARRRSSASRKTTARNAATPAKIPPSAKPTRKPPCRFAQRDEERARGLEQPGEVDPLVAGGGVREGVARGDRARVEDQAAGHEVPPGARVLEQPAGPVDGEQRVDQEDERRERRRQPAAERRRL